MPNRIIKESICSSQDIDDLKAEEEVFYYRLWVNCDDYGRFDARIPMLKSKLYPLRENMKSSDIKRYLATLESKRMVELYGVKGVVYGQVVAWENHQQIRAKRSKYPPKSESDSTCNQMISDDGICPRNPIQSNPIRIQSESESGDKPQRKKFVPPTLEEVKEYCYERNNSVDAEKWHSYYTSNGWKVGKNPMRDWKGAVRTWEQKDKPSGNPFKDKLKEAMENERRLNDATGESNNGNHVGYKGGLSKLLQEPK